MNHAIRITLPYDDCKHIVRQWADRSVTAIVYQHDADEQISKTHIHIALYGCEVQAEALKRKWIDAPGKGNEFWSFKEAALEPDKYVTYMSKGKHTPVFTKNISDEEVERFRQLWVEPVKADKGGDHSEKIINKIVEKIKEEFTYHKDIDEDIESNYNERALLTIVRNTTFKHLWAQKRMFPHGSHYKIVAGTVYMRLAEHYNCFEKAMKLISELWL